MKTKTPTYPTQFYLNLIADREEKRIVLYVRCDDGKRMIHSTGHAIHPDLWSNSNSIPKTDFNREEKKLIKDLKAFPDPDGKILETVSNLKTWVKTFTEAKTKAKQPVLSIELKKFIEDGGKHPKDPTKALKTLTLFEALEHGIDEAEALIKVYSPGTIRNLRMTLRNFETFNNEKGLGLTAENINNPKLPQLFGSFCNGKGWSISYTDRLVKDLKKIFSLADLSLPSNFVRIKRSKIVYSTKITLDDVDFAKLEKVEGLTETQAVIRDMYLVNLKTGFRVSDMKKLTSKNIVDGKIKLSFTQKTKKPVEFLLPGSVKRIIEKYDGEFPTQYNENYVNREIKVIAEKAKIHKYDKKGNIVKVEVEGLKGGEPFKEEFYKWELVSNHTARRSAITSLRNAGVSARDISLMYGLSETQVEKCYDKGKDTDELAKQLIDNPFFQ